MIIKDCARYLGDDGVRKGLDRKVSSLSFLLRKGYLKLSTYKPSYVLFALITVVIAIFLLGGGVYNVLLVEDPLGVLGPWANYPYWIFWPTQSGIQFFLPGRLQDELLGGSIIVMFLYALGTLGLLMTYRSVKYTPNRRHAAILLLMGVIFVLVAFILMESIIINYKT